MHAWYITIHQLKLHAIDEVTPKLVLAIMVDSWMYDV